MVKSVSELLVGTGVGVILEVNVGLGLGVTGVAVGSELLPQLASIKIINTVEKIDRNLFMMAFSIVCIIDIIA